MSERTHDQRRNAATAATEAYEAAPDNPDLKDAAHDAVEELRYLAIPEIFPDAISPVSADPIALLSFALDAVPSARYVDTLLDLHRRSLDSYPELATLIRSPIVVGQIEELAGGFGPRLGRTAEEYGDAEVERFEHEIARQLVGRAEHEPAASALGVWFPALRARLQAMQTPAAPRPAVAGAAR